MGLNKYIRFVLVLLVLKSSAQTAPMTYLVSFKDKAGSPYSVGSPQDYLSQRAIERRQRYNISIDLTDIPVNPAYISGLKSISGVSVICRSKWLNNATVMVNDTSVISAIRALPYVNNVKCTFNSTNALQKDPKTLVNTTKSNAYFTIDSINYGYSAHQVQMLNGQFLHQLGFKGNGMYIAVMDVGFSQVDALPEFEYARSAGRLIQGPDFVRRDGNVYNSGSHGTMVLSCMAPNEPGRYVGTAPDATYFLFVTENDTSEYIVEEDYWVAAAEWADSAGVDVFNTSLGYTQFNDSIQDHTYADLDGNTTRITKAVDLAAKKGILSVNSAGNSGDNAWYYIAAPADADSNLTVGAVGPDGVYATFSSKGPTADGRVKPNVVTQGFQPYIVGVSGDVFPANGTSFSGPIMAGMAACLWQAFPEKNNMQIIRAIEQSASQYNTPDHFVGYGIPDMSRAFHILANTYDASNLQVSVLNNPFVDQCRILLTSSVEVQLILELYDFSGKKVTAEKISLQAGIPGFYVLDVADKLLPAGVYVVKILNEKSPITIKLVKQ